MIFNLDTKRAKIKWLKNTELMNDSYIFDILVKKIMAVYMVDINKVVSGFFFLYMERREKGIFFFLFGSFRPIREFFITHMETSPLPVKVCKFWPMRSELCCWHVNICKKKPFKLLTTCIQTLVFSLHIQKWNVKVFNWSFVDDFTFRIVEAINIKLHYNTKCLKFTRIFFRNERERGREKER